MRCARVVVSLRALSQPVGSDGVLEYCIRTLVRLEYHFWGTRTRNPWCSVSTRTRRSMYSVLGQKKRRVHEYIWLSLEVNKLTYKMNFP